MMASWYAPQIFWVLATALAYTLLALAVAEKSDSYLSRNKNFLTNCRISQISTYPQCPGLG